MTNNRINVKGSINNSFIQQATDNSTQSIVQTVNPDYSKFLSTLLEIKDLSNSNSFHKEFDTNATKTKMLIDKAIILIKEKQEPKKVIPQIVRLKEMASNVGSGIIATGICKLLEQLL